MPSVSTAQNRAMHAAAEGHSTLGIPQRVGAEFVAADAGRKVGALPKRVHPLHALRARLAKMKSA